MIEDAPPLGACLSHVRPEITLLSSPASVKKTRCGRALCAPSAHPIAEFGIHIHAWGAVVAELEWVEASKPPGASHIVKQCPAKGFSLQR